MHESLTLNHAARILGAVGPSLPADGALRRYFTEMKHLGQREKRQISQAVFTYFRWLQWLDRRESLQMQVEQALKLHERFTANTNLVKAEALAALAVPSWTKTEIVFPPESLRQLQAEPTLWIRARPGTAASLAQELGTAEVLDPSALRIQNATTGSTDLSAPVLEEFSALRFTGTKDLFVTPQFHQGAFEIQDLSSQLVGHACAPKPGETWWDACSGEGGKMLHLADLMHNKGLIWATDRSDRRLYSLKHRAARAKIFNFRSAPWDGSAKLPSKTKFDGILIDAPCSGLGTWQRNPHARWSASPDDVRELAAVQLRLLDHAWSALKPGGRLIYSVCTLTHSETTDVANAFTANHPELEPANILGVAPQVILWPHQMNANGMFIASWTRKKPAKKEG